jgi:carboxypeptidase family protein
MLMDGVDTNDYTSNNWAQTDLTTLQPGQVGGIIVDAAGAVVPNAEVTLNNTQTGASFTTRSDGDGHWLFSGIQSGPLKVNINASGFKRNLIDLEFQASRSAHMGTTLEVGTVSEVVNVTSTEVASRVNGDRIEEIAKKNQAAQLNAASQNVFNLQRRVAGILPVAVEVPRSGKSYRFVRPLVLEEETRISFQYKSR